MTNQLKPLQLGASSRLTYFAIEKQYKKEIVKLCLGGAPIQMAGYIALEKKKKKERNVTNTPKASLFTNAQANKQWASRLSEASASP